LSLSLERTKVIYENLIEDYLLNAMAVELADVVKSSPIGIFENKIVAMPLGRFKNFGLSKYQDVMRFDVNFIPIDRNICITIFLGQDFYGEIREVIPAVRASFESGLRGQNIFFKRIFWSLGTI
jgi:hypothetical protein